MNEDTPKDVIKVSRRDDGTLDEIVASGCSIHLERMHEGGFFLAIYKDGYRQRVDFTAVKNKKGLLLKAISEMDDWPHPLGDCP